AVLPEHLTRIAVAKFRPALCSEVVSICDHPPTVEPSIYRYRAIGYLCGHGNITPSSGFGVNRCRCQTVPRLVATHPVPISVRGAIGTVPRSVPAISGLKDCQTVPLPRGPAAAEMCAGAFHLVFEGMALANQRRRLASS